MGPAPKTHPGPRRRLTTRRRRLTPARRRLTVKVTLTVVCVKSTQYHKSVFMILQETPFASAGWSLSESDFREVEYTYAGDYDQVWTGAGVPDYLAVIRPHTHVECPGRGASWRGHNSFVHVQPRHVRAAVPAMAEALQTVAAGTRISLVLPVRDADPSSSLGAMLAAAGFERAM